MARDIEKSQTSEQAEAKSQDVDARPAGGDSASTTHGKLRYASGFSLTQVIAEYRALRASVLKLWLRGHDHLPSGTTQDVMRFNEAIDQSLAEASVAYSDKLSETRDMFLAILGHDLRSPLAATATAGSYLSREGAFDHQVQQIGIRVKRSAATMNGMVEDLLGLARVQLGAGIPIIRRRCDLRQMCAWAIEDATAAHPRAEFALSASGELTGSFDQARLQQLLTNLANNAAQYGAPGKPIGIDIAGEEKRIVLKVHNEGAPIPRDALQTLFTSLVQLPEKDGDDRPRGSLGLGLFIARQIAVAHGGAIDVCSDDVSGTTFTVEVPRH